MGSMKEKLMSNRVRDLPDFTIGPPSTELTAAHVQALHDKLEAERDLPPTPLRFTVHPDEPKSGAQLHYLVRRSRLTLVEIEALTRDLGRYNSAYDLTIDIHNIAAAALESQKAAV
jgi:hypothetical protein